MLNNKEKIFLEKTAKSLQEKIGIERKPNIYNYNNLHKFITELKYNIVFESDSNFTSGNTIYLKCSKPSSEYTDEDFINFERELLYQIWKIAKKKFAIPMMKFDEKDARYFFRAMLMPEKVFVEEVTRNTGLDGMCNIFEMAKVFHVDYTEVSARGNDLGIWNRKGE